MRCGDERARVLKTRPQSHIEVLWRRVRERHVLTRAGVRDHDVDLAFLLFDRCIETIEIVRIARVALDRGDVPFDAKSGARTLLKPGGVLTRT